MSDEKPRNLTPLGYAARSDLWSYPGEAIAPGQMRVTLMGTGWGDVVRPDQKGPSLFVELGNEARDSFVFDCGPGSILNYNALNIPRSRMNPIFLSHLHMDHCSDLPFIYGFGPKAGDRFEPLRLYGPSGPPPPGGPKGDARPTSMGLKNLVEGMRKFTEWHVVSFKTVVQGCEQSYVLDDGPGGNVHEFDYSLECGVAYDSWDDGEDHAEGDDRVVVKHFPALHIIDGAVSYRLEWTPKGASEPLVMVYSGDTVPNEFMLQHGRGADLLIHETAPALVSLKEALQMAPDQALGIVCNSHTPATMLGELLAKTQPRMGVTTHTPVNPQSVGHFISDVRKRWDGPYQLGADFMVFDVDAAGVRTRMATPHPRAWPVDVETPPSTALPLDEADFQTPDLFDKALYSPLCRAYKDGTDPGDDA